MKSQSLAGTLVAVFLSTSAFAADLPVGSMPGIKSITKTTTATGVQPNLFYTQLRISTSPFSVPNDDKGKKRLGKALLETLGLKKETRSIVASVAVSTSLVPYTEYPVFAYKFDGSARLTSVDVIGSATLPLQRLDPAEPIRVKFIYRYSQNTTFNLNAANDALQGLLPAGSLVSLVTQPFVRKVSDVASAVFSLASSAQTSSSLAEEMNPYGDQYAKKIVLEYAKPDGSRFGAVTLDLMSTPTLLRTPFAPSGTNRTGDLKLQPGEGATTLSVNVGGVERNLVAEAKGLPEFVRLSKERTRESAKAFCDAARNALAVSFKLTAMDRALVMHQAMYDSDPGLTRGTWYGGCFDANEVAVLTAASSDLAPPAPTPVPPDPSTTMPIALKDAIGCLMTGRVGSYCSSRAPNPRQIVLDALNEQVRIGQMDYTDLINIDTLDPTSRQMNRDAVVDALAGKASSFACFSRGLYIGVANDTRAYNVLASIAQGKVTGIQVVSIAPDDLQCT